MTHTMTETEKLAKAALAVCDRWDTPDWSDHRHTADFIRDLREALTAWNTRPDEGVPVAWQVKYGDDWITFYTEANAERTAAELGNAPIRPLYTRPAPALDREGVVACIRDAADRGFEAGKAGAIHFRFPDIIARVDALLSASTVEG